MTHNVQSREPIISILMASYNNVQYLDQALEGVFSQQCDYPFVVIIADDASTDGSQERIREWASRHSNIIVAQQRRNCIERNFSEMFSRARTKYVAFCDGDDFWTATDKLQRQVDFLEQNPDFSVCTHKVDVLLGGELLAPPRAIYKRNASEKALEEGVFYADEIADNYYFHVSSYVFRWRFTEGLPPWWKPFMTNDQFMFLYHAADGKIKYFHEAMSVWRRHNSGYTGLQNYKTSAYIRESWVDHFQLLFFMYNFFTPRFHYELSHRINHALKIFIEECVGTEDYSILQHVVARYRSTFVSIDKKFGKIIKAYEKLVDSRQEKENESLCDIASMLPGVEERIAGSEECHIIAANALPLDITMLPKPETSVWDIWTLGREYACYHNAPSALRALLWNLGANRFVSLPMLCDPLFYSATVDHKLIKKRFYPVSNDCRGLVEFVSHLDPDSVVLTIAYFGAPTSPALQQALKARKDIVWIEDRSHAFFPEEDVLADYVLYSAPHVLGVPDGGILVGEGAFSMGTTLQNQDLASLRDKMAKPHAYYERPEAVDAGELFLQADPLERLSREKMSRLSREMLERIPFHDVVNARKRNWRILYSYLEPLALWKIPEPDFAPQAFPLFFQAGRNSSRMASFLADEGIICSRLYGSYTGQRHDMALDTRLFSLPCGHHLSCADMERMAKAVVRLEKEIWR